MSKSIYPMTIYFDASCPLCHGEIRNLMLRNTNHLLEFVDASPLDFVSPIAGVSRTDLMNMIHATTSENQIIRGVEVFRLAYNAVGLGWLWAPTGWPLLRQLADRAYPVLVRNRYRIPRLLVALLFEGPTRRAAERAAQRSRQCHGRACER